MTVSVCGRATTPCCVAQVVAWSASFSTLGSIVSAVVEAGIAASVAAMSRPRESQLFRLFTMVVVEHAQVASRASKVSEADVQDPPYQP